MKKLLTLIIFLMCSPISANNEAGGIDQFLMLNQEQRRATVEGFVVGYASSSIYSGSLNPDMSPSYVEFAWNSYVVQCIQSVDRSLMEASLLSLAKSNPSTNLVQWVGGYIIRDCQVRMSIQSLGDYERQNRSTLSSLYKSTYPNRRDIEASILRIAELGRAQGK